ncbi:MAG: protein kinase [Sedimentisphaerales bacterium]|nr:protein kinase [Sedimentisphaerales bacterium]
MAKQEEDKRPPEEAGLPTANLTDFSAAIVDPIGPYTPLGVLGEGGFGIVYLAEQKHPIKRQVALKIIKPGMDSRRVIARFEAERQALALLDHPNIAHVLEAGSAESGRPYFVMEYIKGLPVTEYCDHHQLNIEQRLTLFIQVCEAIQYAHQKGIIHRDIKPSNIIVCNQDGITIPKIIDFGVAKAIGMPLTDKTLFTQQGQLIGTPEYMSPEQADFKEQEIDTRSDIYSLGVVLYELVAGVLPFESQTLREAGYVEIQHIIREQEPPRPSTKLSHLGHDAIIVAQNRRTELTTLVRSLHEELEWIPLKAIRKDRTLRYQTALELAQDIRNYLEGNPLKAGPETAGYRVHKFVRKYKGPVATAVAIVTLIIVGLFMITAMYLQSEKLKKETVIAKIDVEKSRDEIERQLYNHCMALADASKVYNVKYARQLLDLCPAALRRWEWAWLNSHLDQSLQTLSGHPGMVNSVSFRLDAERIASGGDDNTVKIWDAKSGQLIRTMYGHQKEVESVCFSPDGKRIVSGSLDTQIILWDADSGLEVHTLRAHKNEVLSVCFSPDGKQIASGSADKTILLWDTQSGQQIRSLSGHQDVVLSVCFSPDGKQIASGSADKTILLWDTQSGQRIRSLSGHQDVVLSVRFSPDGKRIASGSVDKQIILWDADTGNPIRPLGGHQSYVISVCFSQDGKKIASGGYDTTIRLWDTETGQEIRPLSGHQGIVSSVCFSSDGRRIASGSCDGTIKVWDAERLCHVQLLSGHQGDVVSVCFSPDGKRIVSGSADNSIKLWDAGTGHQLRLLEGHADKVYSVSFRPDGKWIASGSADNSIKIWDANTGLQVCPPLKRHEGKVIYVCFGPDGRQLASAGTDDKIIIWDTDTGRPLQTISVPWMLGACLGPDGKLIAAGTRFKTIRLWETDSGREIHTLKGHEGLVQRVSFSPDGRRIASGGNDNSIKLWDTQSGHEIRTLNGHQGAIHSICFSPDGKRIVSGSADNTIKIWDTDSGTPLLTLCGHQGMVCSVSFSPDGRRIVSGSYDKQIIIWDIDH